MQAIFKRLVRKWLVVLAITTLFSGSGNIGTVNAQETKRPLSSTAQNNVITTETSVSAKKSMTEEQYKRLRQIIFKQTPAELKKFIADGFDVNSTYECALPINMAVNSLVFSFGSTIPRSPDYAIENVKLLIDAGAELNTIPCKNLTSAPLIEALQLPLTMHQMEEMFFRGLEDEIKADTSKTSCLLGVIPKPCSLLTAEDKKQIRDAIHETYVVARKVMLPSMMKMVKMLVESGSDVNMKDYEGEISLHEVMLIPQEMSIEPIRYLLEKGANVNAQDNDGNTPLFLAFAFGNNEAVKLLIESGADTNVRNKEGLLYNEVRGIRKLNYVKNNQTFSKYVDVK